MNWFEKLQELFTREVPVDEAEFEAIFKRLDMDEFFNGLNNYWNPSELIRKIGGLSKLELLYKDSEIYAAVDKRMAALLDTRLVIDGGPNVKFFQDQIMPFERQLKQDFWWTTAYGYGVEQIIYDPDQSCKVIGFQKEEFWRFEPLRDLIHVKVIDTTNMAIMNKVLPYGKWVLTTNNGTYSNPWGDPMFERLVQPWIFRCNGWDLWMDFAKRFANGFMHGKIGDVNQVADFRAKLEKAGKSSVIVTDKNTELTMIQASRDSSLYSLIDDKTVATMQKVILGETLTSDMQARGSSGAASIHNDVRLEKTRSDISLVEAAINETIKQIAAVCGLTTELPKATLIYDPGLNQELATRDQTLNGLGVKFNKKYYVTNYGLKEDEFEVVEPAPASPFGFSAKKKRLFLKPEDVKEFMGMEKSCSKCSSMNFDPNISRKNTRQQDEKEDLVQLLSRNGEPPINVDDLIAAISTSKNASELEDNLNSLFDTRSTGFVDLMTDALYYTASSGALLGNPERLPSEEE